MSAEQQSSQCDTGVTTRKRLHAATPFQAELSTATITLQSAIQGIHQLREEQQQQLAVFDTLLYQRDEEIRRMVENLQQQNIQLSQFKTNLVESRNRGTFNFNELDFKLKPDIFDGSVPLRKYFAQFGLIARANAWNNSLKTVALASCLRGKARSILDGVTEIENLRFEELKLELHFREGHLSQTYYAQITNRKQKFSEDLPTLGADLKILSRLAYSKCSHEGRDKIACAQFMAALSDGFVKRILQLEYFLFKISRGESNGR